MLSSAVTKIRMAFSTLAYPQRVALIVLSMGAFFGLTVKFPQIAGAVVLCWTLVELVKALLFRMWELGCRIRRPLIRRLVRLIRVMRRFFAIPPEIEFLHLGTILLVLITLGYMLVVKNPTGFNALGNVLLGLVCLAAIVDNGRQVIQLTRITWTRTIGKVVLAGIGAALFYVATAISKQFSHGITATDPTFFPEFSGLFAALAMPVLYLMLGCFVLGLWAIAQLVIAFIVLMLGSALAGITSNALAWKLFLYRLQQGKRPPTNYRAPKIDFRWAVVWMRPFCLLLSICLILSAWTYLHDEYGKSLDAIAVKGLVALEYKRGSKCLGIPAQAEVAYLEGGAISVAKQEGDRFVFLTQKCDLPTE